MVQLHELDRQFNDRVTGLMFSLSSTALVLNNIKIMKNDLKPLVEQIFEEQYQWQHLHNAPNTPKVSASIAQQRYYKQTKYIQNT